VFRVTRWQKPEFDAVQKDLERSFPYCNVEILEWDRTASRFLALIHSVSNPGSYVLYEPAKKKAYDLTQRASWVEIGKRASVMPFTIVAEDGHKISGILTYPAAGRFPSVPVVVRCPTTPWLRAPREFQAESMALAQMGFAVLQLDSRGAWGSGIKRRESIKDGYERALVADIVTAVDKLATRFPINPQRVALIGESYGGFVALRAIQLAPDRFRCAASIDAPLDLAAWMENVRWTRHSTALELTRCYFGDTRSLKEVPLLRHPEKITKPVCLLTFPGDDGAQRTSIYLENRKFASALKRQGTPVEINELDKHFIGDIDSTLTASEPKSTVVELDREFAQRLPQAEAAVYRTLEYFLNAYIYDYQVKLGPLKTLPDVEN
jgi:pimeloyl-ACP methyl ester carboxylesterase